MANEIKKTDVAIGVLIRWHAEQRQILIARRSSDVALGGYWEFPGGKVEPGETLHQCVTREFKEEVGLPVHVVKALSVIEHLYPHGMVRLHPFLCYLDTTYLSTTATNLILSKPQCLAVDEVRWVASHELDQYSFPPANATLVTHLCKGEEDIYASCINTPHR